MLKIDRSFVQDLPDDEEDAAIVCMIAALAQSLGLTLHAEGVEAQAQRHFLLALGCQRAQGFHVSPPLACEEVASFLKSPSGFAVKETFALAAQPKHPRLAKLRAAPSSHPAMAAPRMLESPHPARPRKAAGP